MLSVIRSILPAPRLLLAAVLILIALVSTGCGLKGDLYLPEAEPQSASEPESEDSDDDATRS